jgi:RNA polymerase sigma-70 factor (ECF subfamily)
MLEPVETQSQQHDAVGPCHDDLAELAEAALGGEPRAVRTFVIAIGPALMWVARRMLGRDHPEVEDLVQEAAVNVLDALPRYRGQCSVLHFARRVAVLTAMNARRREAATKRPRLEAVSRSVEQLPTTDPGPEEAIARQTATQGVRELLATLPEPQAEALAMHCVLGFTTTEMANAAGVSVETIRSRLRLAKQALRKRMRGDPTLQEIVEGAS